MKEFVVLVDEQDQPLGSMEKMEAHQKGVLHRAISVLIFNSKGELLLQQRALSKYHSGGLWTNTCCSHPREDETPAQAAARRLHEEMGINPPLEFSHTFIYRAELDKGLTEYELDHVFIGKYDLPPHINPNEASDWQFIALDELQRDLTEHPTRYTEWFKIMMREGKLLGRLR